MGRILIPNYKFIENWSEEELNEFINVPSGIPNRLMDIVQEVIPNINTLRKIAAMEGHPEFATMDREESLITRKLVREDKLDEALDYEVQYAIDFLEKYPQFKPMIKSVEDSRFGILKSLFLYKFNKLFK